MFRHLHGNDFCDPSCYNDGSADGVIRDCGFCTKMLDQSDPHQVCEECDVWICIGKCWSEHHFEQHREYALKLLEERLENKEFEKSHVGRMINEALKEFQIGSAHFSSAPLIEMLIEARRENQILRDTIRQHMPSKAEILRNIDDAAQAS